MRVEFGDRLVVAETDRHARACTVLEVRDPSGEPPYLVRWYDTGSEEVFVPRSSEELLNLGHTTL